MGKDIKDIVESIKKKGPKYLRGLDYLVTTLDLRKCGTKVSDIPNFAFPVSVSLSDRNEEFSFVNVIALGYLINYLPNDVKVQLIIRDESLYKEYNKLYDNTAIEVYHIHTDENLVCFLNGCVKVNKDRVRRQTMEAYHPSIIIFVDIVDYCITNNLNKAYNKLCEVLSHEEDCKAYYYAISVPSTLAKKRFIKEYDKLCKSSIVINSSKLNLYTMDGDEEATSSVFDTIHLDKGDVKDIIKCVTKFYEPKFKPLNAIERLRNMME